MLKFVIIFPHKIIMIRCNCKITNEKKVVKSV